MGTDLGGGFGSSSSLLSSSGPEHKKTVTAQDRQREREEKRRKRQERAMERKRKLKEKEKKKGRQGESLGGVLLSDNDKKLLERWGRMVDGRMDKSQAADNNPGKTNDKKAGPCQIQVGKGLIQVPSDTGESVPAKEPNELLTFKPPQIRQCVTSRMFHAPTSYSSLPIPLGSPQNGDMGMVAVGGGDGSGAMSIVGGAAIGVVAAPCAFAKSNMLKPQPQSQTPFLGGGTVFTSLQNWTGAQAAVGTSQQVQPSSSRLSQTNFPQQPAQVPQTQPLQHPQQTPAPNSPIKLLPSDAFITKPPSLTPNGTTARVGLQDTSTPLPTQDPVGSPQSLDKLCSVLSEQQNGANSQGPSHGPPGTSLPCLSLSDTGLPGTSRTPDIHTVTLQLSKSQVSCVSSN